MSEERHKLKNAYTDTLGAVIIGLIVIGNFIDVNIDGSRMSRGLFLFIYSFHMPLLIFLTGAVWGDTARDRKETLKRALYLVGLYLLMKLMVSITRSALGASFSFSLLKDTRTPWYFWVTAVYGIIAYCLRKVNRTAILVCSLLLALICGYNESVGDFLSISRLIVFSPFFCMGQICGIEQIENWGRKRQTKIISLCVIAAALIFALGFTDKLYFLRPLLTGRSSYKQLKDLYRVGPLLRMVVYMVALVISAAVMALTPRKRLVYISRMGARFPQIYFWYRPVLYILTGYRLCDKLIQKLGWTAGHAVWILIGGLCIVLLSIGFLELPFRYLREKSAVFAEYLKKKICGQLEDNWNKTSERQKMWKYIGMYTIVFAVTFFIAYSAFILGKKSFIIVGSGGDGRTQEYPSLVYIGRYIRRVILSLLHGNSIQMFDINLAMGADVTSLQSYGIFNPLAMLAALIPTKYAEIYLDFIVIAELYLAGLAFSGMCFHFGKKALHIFPGAMIYVFCGWTLYASRHVMVMMPALMCLPLLVWTADMIIMKGRLLPFVFAVAFSALYSFYFLYVLTVFMAVFALVKCLALLRDKELDVCGMLKIAGRGVGGYLLGLGIIAIIFVPSLAIFLESGRFGFSVERNFDLFHYDLGWYVERFVKLIAPQGNSDNLSLAAVVLLALVVSVSARGRANRIIRGLLLSAFLFFLLPVGNYVMNGMQYPATRWTFGLACLLAYIVVASVPLLVHLTKSKTVACILAVLLYGGIVMLMPSKRVEQNIMGLFMLTLTLLAMVAAPIFLHRDHHFYEQIVSSILLVIVVLNVGINGVYKFSKYEGNDISNYPNITVRTHVLETALELEVKPYISDRQGRVESTSLGTNHNMVWQVPTINGYWSVMNANVMEFWQKLEISDKTMPTRLKGTDNRTAVNALLSTKLAIETPKKTNYIPFGFKQFAETDTGNLVYKNEYSLPWGYTYDSAVPYTQIETLNGVEMQEAMLQTVALDTDLVGFPLGNIKTTSQNLDYTFTCKECSWKNGVLTVNKAGATITMTYDLPAKAEAYIRFEGFDLGAFKASSISPTIRDSSEQKVLFVPSEKYDYYTGITDYLVNLGFSEEPRTSCVITLPDEGIFQLENIELIAQPMTSYVEDVNALRAEPLENIRWGTNRLTGTVDLSKNKILCVSVPYSKGWSATVDGEKAEILRGNYMFMCLPLTAGHHDIEFSYCSPGLKLGIAVSLASLCIVIGMLVCDRRKKRAVQESSSE